MAHRSEQGNVLGFVLVGALLVALLLGGIYVVRHSISGSGGNSEVATDQTNNQPGTNAPTDNNGSTNEANNSQSSGGEQNGSSDQALEDALNEQSVNNHATSGNTSPESDTLPETGPADTLVATFGATLLVGAGLSYARSRRLI